MMKCLMIPFQVKYWEIIADNLSKAVWSWGWVAGVIRKGRPVTYCWRLRDDRKLPSKIPTAQPRQQNLANKID